MTGALSPEHRTLLREQKAVTDTVMDEAGLWSDGNAIVFPWRDGDRVTEQRRPDPERKGPYLWTAGEPLHFWKHRDAGPDSVIVVVEGTCQSLAAASWTPAEYSVYGMAGCEGAAKIRLRDFEKRRVVVVLDADAGENLNVYEAGAALAMRMRERGAEVGFLRLSARGTDGLDDVLARDWDPDERTPYLARKLTEKWLDKPASRKPTKRGQRADQAIVTPDTGGRTGVTVNTDRSQVIERITGALVERAGGTSLFNYGNVITRVSGHTTQPLAEGDFLKTLTEHVACFSMKAATASAPPSFEPAWPDGMTVKAVMSESSAREFPALSRVVRTPFLRPDGSVCMEVGYDPTTTTVLASEGLEGTEVSEEPSAEGVSRAVKFIMDEWLGDFGFETKADRANVLAAVLTPFARGLFPLVPLCVVSGSGPGVGKNLLADCLSVVITGEAAKPLPYVQDEDETRKQLTSTFRTGSELFVFDEAHHIKGASLARALTGQTWTDRVLGASTMVEYPNKVTWMSLGNQVFVEGDLYRRVYFVKLSGDDRAHDREGSEYRHPDLLLWTRENRTLLVAAALTVLRGWFSAGRPPFSRGATMGSFEAWDRMMSGVCAFAGHPEFLSDSRERRSESDLFGSYWSAHLEWLSGTFGGNTFTTAQVRQAAADRPEVFEAPMGLDDYLSTGYSRRLGQAYAQVQNRYFTGRRLIKSGMGHKNTIKWQVMGQE